MNIGKQGEKIAVEYFLNHGFNILHTNYRSRYGEIDIICENNLFLVFAEVKSKLSISCSYLSERVNNSKKVKIAKTVCKYLLENHTEKQPRIDVIEVELFKSFSRINHIENAFEVNIELFGSSL